MKMVLRAVIIGDMAGGFRDMSAFEESKWL